MDKVKQKRLVLDCITTLTRGVVNEKLVSRKEKRKKSDLKELIWEKEERRRAMRVSLFFYIELLLGLSDSSTHIRFAYRKV